MRLPFFVIFGACFWPRAGRASRQPRAKLAPLVPPVRPAPLLRPVRPGPSTKHRRSKSSHSPAIKRRAPRIAIRTSKFLVLMPSIPEASSDL